MDVHAAPQARIKVRGRRRLNVCMGGAGAPCVVLAAGLNGSTLDWTKVEPLLAERTRTFAFDKPGMGFSDPGPLPRTASAVVLDLRAALQNAGIDGPYLLVGHSYGGLQMRLFAYLHPKEVCGLVLVDATTDGHLLRTQHEKEVRKWRRSGMAELLKVERMARAGTFRPGLPEYQRQIGDMHPSLTPVVTAMLVKRSMSPIWWRAYRSEARAVLRSAQEVADATRSLGDMPLIDMIATQNNMPEVIAESIRRDRREIVAQSNRGEQRPIDSGHHIPWERPEAVVDAVNDVLRLVG